MPMCLLCRWAIVMCLPCKWAPPCRWSRGADLSWSLPHSTIFLTPHSCAVHARPTSVAGDKPPPDEDFSSPESSPVQSKPSTAVGLRYATEDDDEFSSPEPSPVAVVIWPNFCLSFGHHLPNCYVSFCACRQVGVWVGSNQGQ